MVQKCGSAKGYITEATGSYAHLAPIRGDQWWRSEARLPFEFGHYSARNNRFRTQGSSHICQHMLFVAAESNGPFQRQAPWDRW